MYAYQNNILSIPAKLLYEDWKVMSYKSYNLNCFRGKLIRTKEGRGKGNEAWVSFYDLDIDLQERAIKEFGHPKDMVIRNELEKYITTDMQAIKFFARHRKPNGKPLSDEEQREKATNAMICNAITTVLGDPVILKRAFGKKRTKVWENISDAVNGLNPNKWNYKLPGKWRPLKRRYEAYISEGYNTFIHKGEGQKNASVIKGDIADFILAQYALPIGLTIPEVIERYETESKKRRNWKQLSNSAVYNFLYQPENERIWTIGRNGKEVYDRKYKHTLQREKSNWFPNCYWAVDGTKLDWIHYWDNSSNKMGAVLKINVMFDVYSEKIIGWALSFTESHIEHFKTIKMAVNEAQCRPYYLTYDNQGGHTTQRMQELYNSLVAIEGGTHHSHKAKAHNSPAEQLFARLQKQVINKFWFSDGQSITVKRDDNKFNPDFINDKRKELKTIDELEQAWITAVNIWNNKKHPHFNESRNEVYMHETAFIEKLNVLDIMDKMWIEQKKRPLKYHANGLRFRLKDETLLYEVYDENGNIDIEFRRKNVGKKFIVRYDPEFLDGYIQLCTTDENGNIIHVANAEPKRKLQTVPVLMNEDDKKQWANDYKVKDLEFNRDNSALKELLQRTGITPELEMENQDLLIKCKGNLKKAERSKIESEESLSIANRL